MNWVSGARVPLTEKEWIQRKLRRRDVARYALLRFYYRAVPSTFSARFTIAGAASWFARYGLVVGIAFTPIIFAKWIAPFMGVPVKDAAALTIFAIYQTAVIGVAQILKFVLDWMKDYRRDADERMRSLVEISVALRQVVGLIREQIVQFAATGAAREKRDAVLTHALKCIEGTVKLCMGNLDDRYCCVTLLTFEENDKVKIRARSNVAGRPIGGEYDQTATIAYSVAKYSQQMMAIHHFKRAVKTRKQNALMYQALSLPQKPPYESILALPLPPVLIPGQNQVRRKGVVMIDTARPFEFLGKEADVLTRVQAYLDLINLMLTSHGVGVQPEI